MSEVKCQKKSNSGSCCCNCAHHLPVMTHCANVLKRGEHTNGCICDIQIDWACVPPEGFNCVYTYSGEHGICEMWRDNNRSCDNCANKGDGKKCDECAFRIRVSNYQKEVTNE